MGPTGVIAIGITVLVGTILMRIVMIIGRTAIAGVMAIIMVPMLGARLTTITTTTVLCTQALLV